MSAVFWLKFSKFCHPFSLSLTEFNFQRCISEPVRQEQEARTRLREFTVLSLQLFPPLLPVMELITNTVTDILSSLPEGYLPKWLLFTSALGIFNSIQNFCTDKLTKRVYANKPVEGLPH